MAKDFANNFDNFNQEYIRSNEQIAKKSKVVERQSKMLANSYMSLSVELDNLQKLVKD